MAEYDIIIIGTGAGGGTLLNQIASTGKKILVLDKGGFIPKEKENWDTEEVFVKGRYKTHEEWLDKKGKVFHPGQHYCVGGNTKVYGAALFRMREADFGEVKHHGGVSPAWPIKYDDLKDYYQAAEELYHVNGQRGSDPTEPAESRPYRHLPLPHEPRIQKLYDDFKLQGLTPFPIPIGVKRSELTDAELVLDRFDGYPDPSESKGDSHVMAVKPHLGDDNIQLWTNAEVVQILTEDDPNKVSGVIVNRDGENMLLTANVYCLCAGAINSAALLLKSANDHHPNGLANKSDQVGRNYMAHNNTAMIALSTEPNDTKFGKTFAVNDFYHATKEHDFPLGHIQMLGKSDPEMFKDDAPGFAPSITLEYMAKHVMDFWLTSEDLPHADNRVEVVDGQIKLSYTDNNMKGHELLKDKLKHYLENAGCESHLLPNNIYLGKKIPLAGVAHQCGTTVMGTDPATSVLDTYCKTHEMDNLYVVDGGFFPSSSAVNPALTIMAMAMRVGDHLIKDVL